MLFWLIVIIDNEIIILILCTHYSYIVFLSAVTSPKSDIEIDITEEQFEERPRNENDNWITFRRKKFDYEWLCMYSEHRLGGGGMLGIKYLVLLTFLPEINQKKVSFWWSFPLFQISLPPFFLPHTTFFSNSWGRHFPLEIRLGAMRLSKFVD